jgi:hypothetical protein
MTMEELAAEIEMLKGAESDRAAQAEFGGFMDKYGTKFSGDEGIGVAILGEMGRRGINAAAVGADRVINEILDTIRQEATQVLDKIKADRETVNALVSQVQDIQQAVDAATAGEETTPMEGVLDLPAPEEGAVAPEEMMSPVEEAGMDMGAPPMEGDMGGAPPPGGDMGGAPPPTDMGTGDMGAPGGDMGVEGELPPPAQPPVIPSDKHVKRMIKIKPRQPAGNKPASHILSAVMGG